MVLFCLVVMKREMSNLEKLEIASVQEYLSPDIYIINFDAEGVLCSSFKHDGFVDGGEYDL